jgi:hypothetical protein
MDIPSLRVSIWGQAMKECPQNRCHLYGIVYGVKGCPSIGLYIVILIAPYKSNNSIAEKLIFVIKNFDFLYK